MNLVAQMRRWIYQEFGSMYYYLHSLLCMVFFWTFLEVNFSPQYLNISKYSWSWPTGILELEAHWGFFSTEQSSSHTDYMWTLFFADSVRFPPVILSLKRGICLQLFLLKSNVLLIRVPRSSAVPVWLALVLWALSLKRGVVHGLQRQVEVVCWGNAWGRCHNTGGSRSGPGAG